MWLHHRHAAVKETFHCDENEPAKLFVRIHWRWWDLKTWYGHLVEIFTVYVILQELSSSQNRQVLQTAFRPRWKNEFSSETKLWWWCLKEQPWLYCSVYKFVNYKLFTTLKNKNCENYSRIIDHFWKPGDTLQHLFYCQLPMKCCSHKFNHLKLKYLMFLSINTFIHQKN